MANMGSLTAEFILDTSQAGRTISLFQQQMLQAVKSIDASLIAMSNAMMKVGGSATIMGNQTAAAMNKVTMAAKLSAYEMKNAVLAQPNRMFVAGSSGTSVTPLPSVIKAPAMGTLAISEAEISNSVAQESAEKRIAIEEEVSRKIVTQTINQRIAFEKGEFAKTQSVAKETTKRWAISDRAQKQALLENAIRSQQVSVLSAGKHLAIPSDQLQAVLTEKTALKRIALEQGVTVADVKESIKRMITDAKEQQQKIALAEKTNAKKIALAERETTKQIALKQIIKGKKNLTTFI